MKIGTVIGLLLLLTLAAACPEDASSPTDGSGSDASDASTGDGACKEACDCPQGAFCHNGQCQTDPRMPIYCCFKQPCPPGRWCIDTDGNKSVCAEDPEYPCTNACECGPAHCCIEVASLGGKRCVKHTADPWMPGGETIGGAECKAGLGTPEGALDATYCASDPTCYAGLAANSAAGGLVPFRAYSPQLQQNVDHCRGLSCFGTACNCEPGETCVDTLNPDAPPGKSCLLFSGGSCVSNAIAESFFGFKSDDLLPCCSDSCAIEGEKCDLGWLRGGDRWAYQRVVAACGENGCGQGCIAGLCGDGICEISMGESADSCPIDCEETCGNGWCEVEEVCADDCADRCTDAASYTRVSRICGDGRCDGGQTCSKLEPETCLTCPQDCGACDWVKIHSESTRRTLRGVWGSSPDHVFAVGYEGTILRYDGSFWNPMVSGAEEHLEAVWGSSKSNVFAVGDMGTVLHYDGNAWKRRKVDTSDWLYDIWGSSPSDIFAVGQEGTIFHYDGTSFEELYSYTSKHLYSVWGSSQSNVFVVGEWGTILRFNGTSFEAMTSGSIHSLHGVWGSSSSNVFAVGTWGLILHYDGSSWSKLTSNTSTHLKDVWGTSATDISAIGDDGTIVHYDGSTWTKMASSTDEDLFGVWSTEEEGAFIVGGSGTIISLDNAEWKVVSTGDARHLQAVWGASKSELFAVGRRGTILHHDGSSWESMASSTSKHLYGVWGSAADDVFAVGQEGTILHYDGSSWQEMSSGVFDDLRGVWGTSASNIFAVGMYQDKHGIILHYDGSSWEKMHEIVPIVGKEDRLRGIYGVWGTSASNVFAVGREGVILHYNGSSWSEITLPAGTLQKWFYGVWGTSPTNVFFVGSSYDYYGNILHYDGSSFEKMETVPSLLKSPLYSVWGTSPTNVFAVGQVGTIMHYNGNGPWMYARADLREQGAVTCRDLNSIFAANGDLFIVGEHGLVLSHPQ